MPRLLGRVAPTRPCVIPDPLSHLVWAGSVCCLLHTNRLHRAAPRRQCTPVLRKLDSGYRITKTHSSCDSPCGRAAESENEKCRHFGVTCMVACHPLPREIWSLQVARGAELGMAAEAGRLYHRCAQPWQAAPRWGKTRSLGSSYCATLARLPGSCTLKSHPMHSTMRVQARETAILSGPRVCNTKTPHSFQMRQDRLT